MTFTLFVSLVFVFSIVTSHVTSAVKKVFDDVGKKYASNMVVLVVSVTVGTVGTIVAYIMLGIEFILPNLVCIILMPIAVWLSAMLGYDKVLQMLEQIRNIKGG